MMMKKKSPPSPSLLKRGVEGRNLPPTPLFVKEGGISSASPHFEKGGPGGILKRGGSRKEISPFPLFVKEGVEERNLPPTLKKGGRGGFTLIEILLVVAIIGALAAMIVPRLSGRSEKAKAAVARADIRANIATALKMYEIDMGTFPNTEQGLGALLSAPGGATSWSGPYIEKMPTDPWGRPYQYKSPGVRNPTGYDLLSFGHDGVEGADDIGNWE